MSQSPATNKPAGADREGSFRRQVLALPLCGLGTRDGLPPMIMVMMVMMVMMMMMMMMIRNTAYPR